MPNVFIGENPRLEAVYEDRGSGRCAVITHPHSLMGGNMQNNVVLAAWDATAQAGLSAVRFNFRGVGRSSGSFDEGIGEMDDIAAVAGHVKKPALIVGYSFGSWVAAGYVKRLGQPHPPCIFISPPTGMFRFPDLKDEDAWVITGKHDQFCSMGMLEGIMAPGRITLVNHADHFWFGDEDIVGAYVLEKLKQGD